MTIRVYTLHAYDDTSNAEFEEMEQHGYELIAIVPVSGSSNTRGDVKTFWSNTPVTHIKVGYAQDQLRRIGS